MPGNQFVAIILNKYLRHEPLLETWSFKENFYQNQNYCLPNSCNLLHIKDDHQLVHVTLICDFECLMALASLLNIA